MRIFFRFIQYLIAFFIVGNVLWLKRRFGNITFDQLVFHLTYLEEGKLNFDPYFALSFLKLMILVFIFSASAIFFEKRSVRKNTNAFRFLPSLAVLISLSFCAYTFSFLKYFQYGSVDFFKENYINPARVKINKRDQKNLILIYVEGLENTYSNKKLFGRDLLSKIKSIEGQSFGAYEQVEEGVGWTIGAIVSSQCAVPLKILSMYNGNTQGELVRSFMPGATCLGDTLSMQGYRNVFMGGASLGFSGKGNFLREHGYAEVWGREEWLLTGRYAESDMNGWGLQDEDLFQEAKKKIDKLEALSKPYSLTLLTINTHHPVGFYSKKCLSLGANSFEDIVACTSSDLNDFVAYINAKGYLSNSRVLIIGDHLSMRNVVYDKLQTVSERTIFNYWIGGKLLTKNREKIVHFDIAPSVLDFIGLEVQGGKYGLGYSGFATKNLNIDKNRVEILNSSLGLKSDTYNALWFFDN